MDVAVQQQIDEDEMSTWYEFDSYQDFTDSTAQYPEEDAQEYLVYGLMSEVGELAGKLKREIRDDVFFNNKDFTKELGDVLWYVAQLASMRNIFLSDIAKSNVDKLTDRAARGVLKGVGDER